MKLDDVRHVLGTEAEGLEADALEWASGEHAPHLSVTLSNCYLHLFRGAPGKISLLREENSIPDSTLTVMQHPGGIDLKAGLSHGTADRPSTRLISMVLFMPPDVGLTATLGPARSLLVSEVTHPYADLTVMGDAIAVARATDLTGRVTGPDALLLGGVRGGAVNVLSAGGGVSVVRGHAETVHAGASGDAITDIHLVHGNGHIGALTPEDEYQKVWRVVPWGTRNAELHMCLGDRMKPSEAVMPSLPALGQILSRKFVKMLEGGPPSA